MPALLDVLGNAVKSSTTGGHIALEGLRSYFFFPVFQTPAYFQSISAIESGQ